MAAAENNNEDEIRLKCVYGNKVELLNLRTNETKNFELVTFSEEKLSEDKISNYTEIGRAIWAKHEGDEVNIEIKGAPTDRYRIVSIENA